MRRALVLASVLAVFAAAPARAALPPVKHVFVIVLENENVGDTFSTSSKAPYLANTLPTQGAFLPNYYAVTHLSLGNYIAMVSGQGSNPLTQTDCQVYTNVTPGTIGADQQAMGSGCVYPTTVKTVADQLTARHLSWKGYMEDMGTPCRHPAIGAADDTQHARVGDQYAARHNPFVYFHSITDSPDCAQNDVPLTSLPTDLRSAKTTPSYSFITPNLCNDGHDSPCVDGKPGGLTSADAFLHTWVPQIMRSRAYKSGGLIVITFDEAESIGPNGDSSACCDEPQFPNTSNNGFSVPGPGGGRVGAVLLSPFIDPGTMSVTPYNHFSLLRSVEDLFKLSHLGYAARPKLQRFGSDVFTCYSPHRPRARHRRYRRGALIKLATFSQGTAARPTLALRLRFPARATVFVATTRRHARFRKVGGRGKFGACQQRNVRMPYRHGKVRVRATYRGASETWRARF